MIEYKETIKTFSLHNDLLKDVDFYHFMNHGYSPYSKLVENYKLRYWASLYLKILDKILNGEKPTPGSYRGRINNEPENNRKTLMDLKNA